MDDYNIDSLEDAVKILNNKKLRQHLTQYAKAVLKLWKKGNSLEHSSSTDEEGSTQ